MFFFRNRNTQREKWLDAGFPREWADILRQRMWQYSHLPRSLRERVENVATVMFHERQWTGGNGYQVTDVMRVTIAANAALLTLGLDEPYYFDRLTDIIIYPRPFFLTADQATHWSTDPVFGSAVESPRLGEAWHRGPVLLAWSSILHPERSNHTNVILHELAHHLDGLDGDMSGAPPMSDSNQLRDWFRVTEEHFLQLVGQVRRDEATLLDHYGASDRVEFFAVATECFFERPHDLKQRHPRLFEVLATYFRHDPTTWMPREHPHIPGVGKSSRQTPHRLKKASSARRTRQAPRGGFDDPFSEGVYLAGEGWLEEAVEAFGQAVADDPEDAEAWFERSLLLRELDRWEEALADAEQGLAQQPDDPTGLVARGSARVLLGDWQGGLADIERGISQHDDVVGRWCMGLAHLRLGDPRRALHQLDIAISTDPYDPQAYRLRGEIHEALGNADAAARDAAKARHLEPTLPDEGPL